MDVIRRRKYFKIKKNRIFMKFKVEDFCTLSKNKRLKIGQNLHSKIHISKGL